MAREIFAIDEWYHCYTRGVDKRTVFEDVSEYERFKHLLYLCNGTKTVHRSNLSASADIYAADRGDPLVAIGAYCLMPNHFHVLIREVREGGLSEFMRKVGIAYALFFNKKHDRVGNLFVKPFRAKHVSDDEYFKRVAQYIHLNPAELFEPGWKEGRVGDMHRLREALAAYPHSSLPDYRGVLRPERVILDADAMDLIADGAPPLEELVVEALLYYRDMSR
jgi:putative transposase